MGSEYDENLEENPFFQQIRNKYGEILKTTSENNWIICVPRSGSFKDFELSKNDILEHILIPNEDGCYHNLNHVLLERISDALILKSHDISRRVRVLFHEDFFVEKHKYSVWCIDEVLTGNSVKSTDLIEINSFCDCINFLWTDTLRCKLLDEINSIVQASLSQVNYEELDFLQLRSSIQNIYDHCLYCSLRSFQMKLEDANFLHSLKLAVETFMYACMKGKLFNCLCTLFSESDASLNKIIRNSQDIPLRAFKISHDFYDLLPLAKLELNKINNSYTIINKILCLKRAFKALSKELLNSETLLEIFVFLIIKSNISNWTANLIFMRKLRFSDAQESDESNFLITTLQAAVKYLNDGGLNKLQYNVEFETCHRDFHELISLIEKGNLNSVINAVTCGDKLIKQLCHPLCSCDNCEIRLKTNTSQIDGRDEKGKSLLHLAAKLHHPDIVQFLIAKGVNVNSTDYSGLTPLHYAVSSGNQQATFLLLHAGSDKNIRDSEGNAPLHIATRNGQESCVKALIYFNEDRGNDLEINCVNNSGDTPLHFASRFGYANLVKLLVDCGAKIVFNNRSLSAYQIAHNNFIKNILKTVSILNTEIPSRRFLKEIISNRKPIQSESEKIHISETKSETKSYENVTFGVCPKNLDQFKRTDLLLNAIENNDLPLTCFYLGIPMPFTSSKRVSNCHPLCICEKCQEVSEDDVASDDCKKQALNINICNPEGYTPLHIAAKYGRIEIVRLLLDVGAQINLTTYKVFYTALHLSSIFRKKHIVKELLSCGNCHINPIDCYGNTPLHYACLNDDLEMFETLISHGADVKVKNRAGKTVTQEAEERMFFGICRTLRKRREHKRCDIDDIL